MIDKKQLENVKSFKYLGSTLNDGRCTCEIKSRIVMAKAKFNNKRALFTNKMDLGTEEETSKMVYLEKTVYTYSAETWTLRAVDQKHLECFEMWCWRRMEISCTDHVRNEEVILKIKEQRNILHGISNGRLTGLVTFCVETAFYDRLLKER
jgi:hypothetical protein